MRLKPALAFLFILKVSFGFAQQIDLAPYAGLNNNITNVVLKMQTTLAGDPIIFNTMGAGVTVANASFNGGFYTSVIFKNNFGLQSGVRFFKSKHSFFLTEVKHFEFGNTLIYNFKSDRLAVPLHLVYDLKSKVGSTANQKVPGSTRFFAGPVLGYDFNQKTRMLENHAVFSTAGVLIASYSDVVTTPGWLQGVEFGINVNPVFNDLVSLGFVFQYNLAPVAKVNFESQTSYESPTARVEVKSKGSFTVIGSSIMLQLGIKPFILKKE